MKIFDKFFTKLGEGIGTLIVYVIRAFEWLRYNIPRWTKFALVVALGLIIRAKWKSSEVSLGEVTSVLIIVIISVTLIWGKLTDVDRDRTTSREFDALSRKYYSQGDHHRGARMSDLAYRAKQYEKKRRENWRRKRRDNND